MMLKSLALAFTLNISLTLLIVAASIIGASQPPPFIVTTLQLNECQLPCWIGIVPGVTTMNDLYRRITDLGASSSMRLTGSMSTEGRLIGEYRLAADDEGADISVLFSEGNVSQIVMFWNGVALGDLILAYGTPCVSAGISSWNLVYTSPTGRATFVVDAGTSIRYTSRVEMSMLETQLRGIPDRVCVLNPYGLTPWQGIAPSWRYDHPPIP